MLMQILTRTPLYVWAILAYLVYRGLVASREREVKLRTLAIIPLIMLGLGIHGMLSQFGLQPGVLFAWLLASGAGVLAGWPLARSSSADAIPERQAIIVRASWIPMAMMLTIFIVKYLSTVAIAIKPALPANVLFASSVCAVLGLCSGVLSGTALHVFASYRRAHHPALARMSYHARSHIDS